MKKIVSVVSGTLVAAGLAVALLMGPGCSSDSGDTATRDTVAPTVAEPADRTPIETGILEYEPYLQYNGTTFPDAFAITTQTARRTSTTLWDPTKTEVLATLVWSIPDGTVTWSIPDVGDDVGPYDGFQVKLTGSDGALYYIYKNVQDALASTRSGGYDPWADEGCDYFPDPLESECVLACCATHDACWEQNDCGLSSWIPFVGSSACKACNRAVVGCIAKCAIKKIIEIGHQQH